MPASGVTLHALSATHPQAERLRSAFAAIGLDAVGLEPGASDLRAVLDTPRGRVSLHSQGL
jgi:hypothetical protein